MFDEHPQNQGAVLRPDSGVQHAAPVPATPIETDANSAAPRQLPYQPSPAYGEIRTESNADALTIFVGQPSRRQILWLQGPKLICLLLTLLLLSGYVLSCELHHMAWVDWLPSLLFFLALLGFNAVWDIAMLVKLLRRAGGTMTIVANSEGLLVWVPVDRRNYLIHRQRVESFRVRRARIVGRAQCLVVIYRAQWHSLSLRRRLILATSQDLAMLYRLESQLIAALSLSEFGYRS